MSLKPSDIYLNAATIDELLSKDFISLPGEKLYADKASLRLAAWCKSAVSGNWDLFLQRLKRDELDLGFILGRFANPKLANGVNPPQWAEDAVWVNDALCNPLLLDSAKPPPVDPLAVPFDELFVGLVEEAYLKVLENKEYFLFTPSALASLQKTLIKHLSLLCTPVLYELLMAYLTAHKKANDSENPSNERKYYLQFIAHMQKEGFTQLFSEKPVLLRLISVLTGQWVSVSRELLERLTQDYAIIQEKYCKDSSLKINQVIQIEPSLSDHHNSGRSVHILEFESGLKIVYKPKDPRLDEAWANLINSFNDADSPISLKVPMLLAMDGYSWVEYIPNIECKSDAEVENFYFRAGAWLAIFHLFAGMDMHYENIIAQGENPVPIDVEMLLQASDPQFTVSSPEKKAQELAVLKTQNSVLMVGMLPTYSTTKDNRVISTGGLEQNNNPNIKKEWRKVNTDNMELFTKEQPILPPNNLPVLDGKVMRLGDYLEVFLDGFEQYSRFLMKFRDQVGVNTLLDPFKGLNARKVFRPTRFYYALTQRIRDHRNMRDSVTWSAELDFVCRFVDWEKVNDPLWPIASEERHDMVNLNIPFFYSTVNKSNLTNEKGLEIEIQSKSGLERAYERLVNLDEQDLKWQSQLIKASTTNIAKYKAVYESTPSSANATLGTNETFLLNEAGIIAKTISDLATRVNNSATWIGIHWIGDSGFTELAPLGPELYGGNSGIGLFLAAYGVTANDQEIKDLAIASVAGLRHDISSLNANRFARLIGLGGGSGIGSIVYSLTALSEILNKPELIEDAKVAAALITNELIESDRKLDMIGGVAGGIVCLLKLYRASPEPWILEKAILMGEHLIKQNRFGKGVYKSFSGDGSTENPLCGMSHGAAGFAYALASLAKASNRKDFQDIAMECLNFENEHFNEEYQNWPPLHQPGKSLRDTMRRCMWCHGGIGIGLARLASEKFSDIESSELRRDTERSIRGARKNLSKALDTLCCGTMGGVELFYEIGKTYQNQKLIEESRQQLVGVINAAHESTYRFGGAGGIGEFHLGLFRGISGIGYTIMRQLNPQLPNVLIWE